MKKWSSDWGKKKRPMDIRMSYERNVLVEYKVREKKLETSIMDLWSTSVMPDQEEIVSH